MYDNAPDPQDGAVPGCSTDMFSTDEDSCTRDSSSTQDLSTSAASESNVQSPLVKRRKGRSFEAVMQRYAENMTNAYENIQNKIVKEQQIFIEKLMETERQHEKALFSEILQAQKDMLKETTSQLITGVRNIFSPMIPTEIPISTRNPNSQQFFGSLPTFPNNFHSQATYHSNPSMYPGNPFRSVLVNLNRGTITKHTDTMSKPSKEPSEVAKQLK